MQIIFLDPALEELYFTGKTKNRKYRKICKKQNIISGYMRAVDIMHDVTKTSKLVEFSFLHYEKLRANKSGLSSVRLDNRCVERLIFREVSEGIEVELIEIDENHYGDKK